MRKLLWGPSESWGGHGPERREHPRTLGVQGTGPDTHLAFMDADSKQDSCVPARLTFKKEKSMKALSLSSSKQETTFTKPPRLSDSKKCSNEKQFSGLIFFLRMLKIHFLLLFQMLWNVHLMVQVLKQWLERKWIFYKTVWDKKISNKFTIIFLKSTWNPRAGIVVERVKLPPTMRLSHMSASSSHGGSTSSPAPC